jgi:hypothetical protein
VRGRHDKSFMDASDAEFFVDPAEATVVGVVGT